MFSNGMTLNKLALAMWERLGYRDIDASVVSRVLKGERYFSQEQLGVFCKLVGVTNSETEDLRILLHKEIYRKFRDRYFLDLEERRVVETTENNLELIKEANACGAISLARNWANVTAAVLRKILATKKGNALRSKLLQLKFEVLNQESISILRSEMAGVLYGIIWKKLTEMEGVATELSGRNKLGIVYTLMGDTLDIVSRDRESRELSMATERVLEKSLLYIDESLRVRPLGLLALTQAALKNKSKFAVVKDEVYKLINGSSPSDCCESYNLIARGKIILGIHDHLEDDFVEGWSVWKKMSNSVAKETDVFHGSLNFRKVQLERTEVEASISGFSFRDNSDLKRTIADVLFTSRDMGYTRYFESVWGYVRDNAGELEFDLDILSRPINKG